MKKKTKNNIFYTFFGGVILFLILLAVQTYIKRGVRARIRMPRYMDKSLQKSERIQELNRLKAEGKIKDEIYLKILATIESE